MHLLPRQSSQSLLFFAGLATGGLLAFFCWAMLTPNDPSPHLFRHQDKVMHFVAFGMMAGPGALALPRRYLGFVVMTLVSLAGGIEVAQEVSARGREGSLPDFLAGAFGVLCACVLLSWFAERFMTGQNETAAT